jgi:hypothetical protein
MSSRFCFRFACVTDLVISLRLLRLLPKRPRSPRPSLLRSRPRLKRPPPSPSRRRERAPKTSCCWSLTFLFCSEAAPAPVEPAPAPAAEAVVETPAAPPAEECKDEEEKVCQRWILRRDLY